MLTYSFGEDSPLKLQIPERTASLYNEAVEEFFKAQRRFNQKFGRAWDPDRDPIEIRWNGRQKKAWNDFAQIFAEHVKENGPYFASDIMDDFLVKNVDLPVAVASEKWSRAITVAAGLGALYGFLRGL